jgi:hypothetical protein
MPTKRDTAESIVHKVRQGEGDFGTGPKGRVAGNRPSRRICFSTAHGVWSENIAVSTKQMSSAS